VWSSTKNAKNETRKDTHIKFYNVIAAPMLTYGSENWALNRSENGKMETAEMCFLRHVCGYTLTDHVHNMAICNALQICALEERIEDYKNKWHNHILRMDISRLTEN
jgi:hypothetical protein